MRTMRRLVASFGAALALGLAMTGTTLAADPLDVDLSGTLEGDGQVDIDLDLRNGGADAGADVDAAATVDADVALDADAVLDADAALDADADVAAEARATLGGRAQGIGRGLAAVVADAGAEAVVAADVGGDTDIADNRARGFLALDVCARLALLGKTGPCDDGASGSAGGGDAVVDADADATLDAAAALDVAPSDGVIGPDDATLAAAAAADACVRAAILGDAGTCSTDSAPGAPPDDDANAVEALARLATAVDAAVTDEGTAATAALDACASLAINGDASACGATAAPDDGDSGPDDGGTGPGTETPGAAPDDGAGTAPGAITRPDAAAGQGPGGSLPDTASMLLGDPFVPLAVFLGLLAGSAALRRVRIAMR